MADERTFTQTEHFALLTDAVARETAALSNVKETLETQISTLESEKASLATSVTDLQAQIDVLDAEKAAAEKARDDVAAEFEGFKNTLTEMAAADERKADRITRVKAANAALGDEYFTDARAQRWAEMSEEVFEALVSDITEAAAAMGPHKFVAGDGDDCKTCGKTEKAGMHGFAEKSAANPARETAAFTGGTSATGSGSLFGQFLTARGHGPAVNA